MPYIGFSNDSQLAGIVLATPDINGTKLTLDADADTSITADTDDTIDIEIAGADDFQFTANTFTVLSGSTLTVASGATIANSGTATGFSSADPSSADGDTLGTASAEWSDLYLADSSVIYLGADQDVTLTHVADTGVLLNSSRKIQFGDSATFIHQSSDGVMTIDGEATIDLNASTAVLVSNDLKLNSDSAVLGFGVDNDITLTHAADAGLTTNGTFQATTITATTAVVPDASDGAALGTTSLEWSDLYLADGAVLGFGDDQDVTLTHVADTGLILKNAHTSGNSGIGAVLTLQTGDTDMADGNVMGHIKFQAPDEGAGTDAILVGAGILAEAEGDFSSSSNATALVFQTASTATAAEQMRLDSNGDLGIGVTNPTRQLHIAKSAAADFVALTDGATITPDFAAGQNFSVTLAGNRTLANPTDIVAGQTGSVVVTQDGTGSRTLAYGTYWDFAAGTAPTLTTTAAAVDRLDYVVASATDIHAVATLALS
jgi:hypothetical protein